ncbi:MAG TPA: MFS transporter [Thermoanaerobaculia bacterium]|nr:MFS transporter [Thermoanaerobaculia bacterium]
MTSTPHASTDLAADAAPPKRGYVRWTVCALLLFATTINYIDRQVLGILAPTLQHEIGWSELQYGYIVTAFQAAYAIGLLLVGRVLDVIGTKLGFAIAIVFWSIAAMLHAIVRTPLGFGMARFGLGLGEAGNFPAAIKTVAEWFPKKERALATGIFNGGSNLGAIIAPAIVPLIALTWSWQVAFLLTGAIGFLWLGAWLLFYEAPEKHKRISREELAYIRSDAEEAITPIPWSRIIKVRQTWAFALGKFLTDPVWWFYLYWLAKFLNEKHGVTLSRIGLPIVVIYVVADIGSIGGGWLSSRFMKMGWSVNKARKVAMLICALCVVPVIFAPLVSGMWTAVAIISLAAAAHQGWSANIFTTVSDMFPRRAVGSVVGVGGMAGGIGGMFIATATGYALQLTGSYHIVFLCAGLVYLIALAVIHTLAPQLEPADV